MARFSSEKHANAGQPAIQLTLHTKSAIKKTSSRTSVHKRIKTTIAIKTKLLFGQREKDNAHIVIRYVRRRPTNTNFKNSRLRQYQYYTYPAVEFVLLFAHYLLRVKLSQYTTTVYCVYITRTHTHKHAITCINWRWRSPQIHSDPCSVRCKSRWNLAWMK